MQMWVEIDQPTPALKVGIGIDSGIGLWIKIIDSVFINKTLSTESAYQQVVINRRSYQQLVDSR
jgi:hypothetical protein